MERIRKVKKILINSVIVLFCYSSIFMLQSRDVKQVEAASNEEVAWVYFTTRGYTAEAAAGIIGNFYVESGMDPTKMQYGGGPGRGIAQWGYGADGGRFNQLIVWAKSVEKSEWALETQLEWTVKEMVSYGMNSTINSFTSVDKATEYFGRVFERPACLSCTLAERTNQASAVFSRLNQRLIDGSYIRIAETGEIYTVAGGGVIYVSAWNNVGGVKLYRNISLALFNKLKKYPVDGTYVVSTDGTVYIFAGGAPIAVSSWTNVPKPVNGHIKVDSVALEKAGQAGPWSHIRKTPVDGTYVVSTDGTVYIFAGGAPIAVSSWANVPEPVNGYTRVDSVALARAGQAGPWSHVRQTPADGTYVVSTDGTVYIFAGGAPIAVSSWANVPQPMNGYTRVDSVALAKAGQAGPWSHVRQSPVDGTYVVSTDGTVYIFAGGAALVVKSWSNVAPPVNGYTRVDTVAIAKAGENGAWSHIMKVPADGTIVRSGVTGDYYAIKDGKAVLVTNQTKGTIVDPVALVSLLK